MDEYFADIPRRAAPVPLEITTREPERTEPRFITATAPNVPLPLVGALWKVPGVAHPDAAALEVLDQIMSGGDNSRMHKALVRTGKAVQSQHFASMSEEGGFLANFAVVNPMADADEVNALLDCRSRESAYAAGHRCRTCRSEERDFRLNPAPPRNCAGASI